MMTETLNPVVAIDDKIKTIEVPSIAHANGRVATVVRYNPSGGRANAPYVTAADESYTDADGIYRPATEWNVYSWEKIVETDVVVPEEPSEMRALRESLTTLTSERDRYRDQVVQAHRAFEVASGILIREANDRGWCEAYDSIIDEINGDMPGPYRFEEREQDYDIEVEISATVTYTTTVSVTARSEEQAQEMVNDDPESYVDAEEVLRDNYRYVNVTIDSIETA